VVVDLLDEHIVTSGDPQPTRAGQGLGHGQSTSLIIIVIQPCQPCREAFYGDLELGVEVDELDESLREPGEGDLLVTSPALELLDPAIREVHQRIS
jgi:hypothetical protein